MKLQPLLFAGALATLICGAPSAHATVLTFDGAICDGPGQSCIRDAHILQSYGDSDGVDVQYNYDITNSAYSRGAANAALRWWDNDYNDLQGVAYGAGGDVSGIAEIFIKPLLGQSVTLNSFDLGAWSLATRTSAFNITDGLGNILYSSGQIWVGNNNSHSAFSFTNLTSTTGLGIQWGPAAFNVGIDNVDFSVGPAVGSAVPEPQTWICMILGLAAVGVSLRRRVRPVQCVQYS